MSPFLLLQTATPDGEAAYWLGGLGSSTIASSSKSTSNQLNAAALSHKKQGCLKLIMANHGNGGIYSRTSAAL